jgi:hypothetical protein
MANQKDLNHKDGNATVNEYLGAMKPKSNTGANKYLHQKKGAPKLAKSLKIQKGWAK